MTKETKKEFYVRAVDGGGAGFRRADVLGTEVRNLAKIGPVKTVDELLDFVCGDLIPETKGVAFVVAGEIENYNKVIKSPNIHLLDGVAFGDLTRKKSGRPAIVCNDMEGSVMGMAALLPKLSYFMGITWSSGIGLRFYKNGEILADSEGGHILLDSSPYASRCGCGVRGCAESIIGGLALRRRVINETKALGITLSNGIDPCRFLDESYDKGEEWAINIYDMISTGMASFLATIQTLFRLPTIVWKGTFAKNALPRIEKDIRLKMRKKLFNPSWSEEVRFIFSPKPEEDALIGAAQVLLKSLK